jgi:hypothetical protein
MDMNIKALITTLILGSSSAALAKPVVTFSGSASVSVGSDYSVRDHRTTVVRDHRDPDCVDPIVTPAPVRYQPYRPLPPREPWFNPTNTIAGTHSSQYTGTFGRSSLSPHSRWMRPSSWFSLTEATRIDGGKLHFGLLGQGGYFTQLHLKNLGGRTDITMVGIEYKVNGRDYMQVVRHTGSLSGMTINLERDSRTINRIIVYGTSGRGSAFQMLAK